MMNIYPKQLLLNGFLALAVLTSLNFSLQAQNEPDKNYVKTFIPQSSSFVPGGSNLKKNVQINTQYVDGLGRPLQTVSKEMTEDGKDMVQIFSYDSYGRPNTSYLPYPSTTTDGKFNDNASTAQVAYYDLQGNYAKSTTSYEASPLNRALVNVGPGEDWENNPVSISYGTNTASQVRLWSIELNTQSGELEPISYEEYPAGTLSKTATTDEDLHVAVEFKDYQGKVVLKQVEESAGVFAETYYVYDQYSQLRFVIPPMGVEFFDSDEYNNVGFEFHDDAFSTNSAAAIANKTLIYGKNGSVTLTNGFQAVASDKVHIRSGLTPATVVENIMFEYRYDGQRRLVWKRVPGSDPLYLVYDELDRLVMTQDGEQRLANEWSLIKYDAFNRPVLTGIYTHTSAISQSAMSTLAGSMGLNETYDGTGSHGYTTDSVWPTTNVSYRTVTFYDNYAFKTSNSTIWPGTTGWDFVDNLTTGITPQSDVIGQITGTKTVQLDGVYDQWIQSINYYDERYRLIQTQTSNVLGGRDIFSNKYDFVNLTQTRIDHDIPGESHSVFRVIAYDDSGRLYTLMHNIDDQPANIWLLKNKYDELGQLMTKSQFTKIEGTPYAQTVDYNYNIRGWLKDINGGTTFNDINDLFGMELMYQDGSGTVGDETMTGFYNGNISGMKWKASSPGDVKAMDRAFAYKYDGLNRLEKASYGAYNGVSYSDEDNFFNVSNLDYDKNGNILSLNRSGDGNPIDALTYTYGAGNQLIQVSDGSNNSEGFTDGTNSGDDYAYDENGNMIVDNNKGITITYNELNLPHIVTKGSDQIEYIYDAAGIKLQQIVTGSKAKTTSYIGEFIYEEQNSVTELQFVQHEEGRAVWDGTEWDYQYNLTDHLGNVRMTYSTAENDVEYLATFETENTEEETLFDNMSNILTPIPTTINHTVGGDEVVMLDNSHPIGPGLSIKVYPGDVVDMEAFGIYMSASGYGSTLNNLTTVAAAVGNAFGGSGSAEEQIVFDALEGAFALASASTVDSKPAAYLNYMLFDDDMQPNGFGFDGITTDGSNAHDSLTQSVTITAPGYIFVYLSNESSGSTPVYFDDFKVTHHQKMQVVQDDNYYPFGLTFNSYQRPSAKQNDYLYNGKEMQDELDLGWMDYGARMYDGAIGRFNHIDPHAESYYGLNPYHYVYNNPLLFIDPTGMDGDYYNGKGEYLGSDGIDDKKVYQTTNEAYDQNIQQNDEGKFAYGSVPGDQDFDGLKSDASTHYLGKTNEFGLIQLTGMGNDNIVNNSGSEDTYSYTNKAGNTVAAGKHGDDWVKPSTGAAFNAAVNNFVKSERDPSIKVMVNDGSAFNPSFDLGHNSHFTGKSIDSRFLNGTTSGSSNINNLTSSQVQQNGRFVSKLKAAGFPTNHSQNGTIPGTTHSPGHHNHLHTARLNSLQE